MRYIVKENDIHDFNFCPYCGSNFFSVYDGDYRGQVECYDCGNELQFIILEEYRSRFPKRFKKEMEK